MVERYVAAVRSGGSGGALWCWHAVMLCHSSCLAIILVLCQSCCQHFPWYSLSCYMYTHFCQAILPWCRAALPLSCRAAAVMPPCRCACCLPLHMLLTVAHVAYHCSATLPLLYSLVGNTDYQFYPLCHSRSTFHCLTTLPFSS